MIFIGYLPSSKGYYFWDPKGHVVVESCDVVFDKSHFPNRKDLPQQKVLSPPAVKGLDSSSPSDQDDSENDSELITPNTNQSNRRVTRSFTRKTLQSARASTPSQTQEDSDEEAMIQRPLPVSDKPRSP